MRVAVVGAGVAGAAAAGRLHDAGAEVLVLEASSVVGGRTATVRRGDFFVDSGAIFVMGTYDRTLHYLRRSGHDAELTRWAARTAILDEGALHAVRFDRPASFLRLSHLTWGDRARLVRAIAVGAMTAGPGVFDLESLAEADDGETVEQWGRRVVGDRVYEYMLRPLMEPLTGAELSTISASFTKALLRRPTRTALTVPRDGVGSLAQWLLEGLDVETSRPVETIAASGDGWVLASSEGDVDVDAVVIATDSGTARRLVEDVVDPAVTAALAGVSPIRTHHVWLGYATDPWPDAKFDLVVPVGPGRHRDFGVLLNGRRSPRSVPAGGQSVSVYFDGEHGAGLTDAELVDLALQSVGRAFGPAVPDLHEVFTLDHGLVAPTPGHYASMIAGLAALPPTLHLAGDYLTHAGMEGALISGERAADAVLRQAAPLFNSY